MEANGFGGGSSGLFGMNYPITKRLPSLALRAETFRSRSSIGGKLDLAGARVEGRRGALIRWQVVSFTPLYSYYSRQHTSRIIVGPSIQFIHTEAGINSPAFSCIPGQLTKVNGVVPGLVVEAGVRFPAQTPFFIELGGQYEAAFGQLHNKLHLPSCGKGQVVPYDLNFNRFMLTVGFGLRLNTQQ
jgi:hypothetical protein